jgi:hypothetical protein
MYSLRALWKHRRRTFSSKWSLAFIPIIASIFLVFYVATSSIFITSIITSIVAFLFLTYVAAFLKISFYYESDIARVNYTYDLKFSTFVYNSALAFRILGYKIDLTEMPIIKENPYKDINFINIKTGELESNLHLAFHQSKVLEYKSFLAILVNSTQDLQTFYCADKNCSHLGMRFSLHSADHIEEAVFKNSVDFLFESANAFNKYHLKLNYKALTFLLLKLKLRNNLNGFGAIWLREERNLETFIKEALNLNISPSSLNKMLNFNVKVENWVELKDTPEKWLEKVFTKSI